MPEASIPQTVPPMSTHRPTERRVQLPTAMRPDRTARSGPGSVSAAPDCTPSPGKASLSPLGREQSKAFPGGLQADPTPTGEGPCQGRAWPGQKQRRPTQTPCTQTTSLNTRPVPCRASGSQAPLSCGLSSHCPPHPCTPIPAASPSSQALHLPVSSASVPLHPPLLWPAEVDLGTPFLP